MSKYGDLSAEDKYPVVMADSQGVVTWVNEAFENAFGWECEELKGRLITVIMPAKFHDAHNLGFSRFVVTNQATLLDQPLDLEIVTKSGNIMKARHIITAEKRNGETHLAAKVIPLSAD